MDTQAGRTGLWFAVIAASLLGEPERLLVAAAEPPAAQSVGTSAPRFNDAAALPSEFLPPAPLGAAAHAWDLPLVMDPASLPIAPSQPAPPPLAQPPLSQWTLVQPLLVQVPLDQPQLDQPLFNSGALPYLVDESAAGQSSLTATIENEAFDDAVGSEHRPRALLGRLLQDQANFYSPESLLLMGSGLIVGATLANTSLDRDIQAHLQSSLHHANTDEWLESLHANKEFGDGRITLPIFAGAWVLGGLLPRSRTADRAQVWGERTLRGFLVGAPPLLALQLATGGSRPGETSHGSEWEPLRDNNGVSGHSFMGALPFITAAKMSDSLPLKATFYAASALAPLSRTADGAHYPSQIALGWWMAYLSASAIHATDRPQTRWRLFPTTVANASGMALEYRF